MRIRHRRALTLAVLLTSLITTRLGAQTPADYAIEREQRRIQRSSRDSSAYHRLGDAYVQKARATGDMAYLVLAEQSLRKSLAIDATRAGAATHLAHVFSARHEFREAAIQALDAIALDPGDGNAHGVLGDAYLELGEYDRAGEAYDTMFRLTRDLASYGRSSGLKSLHGDPRGAIEDLRRAVASGQSSSQPRESVAWAEWQLGAEHFAIGELDAAEAQYQAALRTSPGYHRALAGLAQVRTAQARHDEAVELYRKALAVTPFPEYAAALGDLYTKMGRPVEARRQYDLVEYIGRLNTLNKVIYNRELAYFYADHDVKLDAALDLARNELESRRDIYGYDALAWALHKSGRSREALAPMDDALRLGTRDAKLFFHAGMIHRAIGNGQRAREYLTRALSINPRFHVLQADEAARVLDELGRGAEPGSR